jgi:hypothetical protein
MTQLSNVLVQFYEVMEVVSKQKVRKGYSFSASEMIAKSSALKPHISSQIFQIGCNLLEVTEGLYQKTVTKSFVTTFPKLLQTFLLLSRITVFSKFVQLEISRSKT